MQDLGFLKETERDSFEFNFSALEPTTLEKGRLENEPTDLAEDFKGTAEEIAELLAAARRSRLLTNDGLVYLTSCLTVHDCVASIAAEIYIFEQQISKVINWVKSAFPRKTYSSKFILNLRDHSLNQSWTAINSGREKYKDYKQGAGQQLIRTIIEHYSKEDRFKMRAWEKYWKSEVEEDDNKTPDLHMLCDQLGLMLIEVNVLLIYLHQLVFELSKREGYVLNIIEERKTQQSQQKSKFEAVRNQIKRIQEEVKKAEQITLDFVNAALLDTLYEQEKALTKELKSTNDSISYWEDYSADNKQRVNDYYSDFKNFTGLKFPLSSELANLNSDFISQMSGDELGKELFRGLNTLDEYHQRATESLQDFSSLVPQWGKINPIVNYSCVIHINTPSENPDSRQILSGIVKKVLAAFEAEEFTQDHHAARSVVLIWPQKQYSHMGYFIGGKGQFKIDRMIKLVSKLLFEITPLKLPFRLLFYPQVDRPIKAFYNKQRGYFDEVHEDFYSYFNAFERQCLNLHNSLLVFRSEDNYTAERYERVISETLRKKIKCKSLAYSHPNGRQQELLQIKLAVDNMSSTVSIAIITALPKEFAAMRVMLDSIDSYFQKPDNDANDYCRGIIKSKQNVDIDVIVVLAKGMGNNLASSAAAHVLRSFPSVQDIIMVGIAGGVPDIGKPDNHVRLGDIVVSNEAGVLQYDNIKAEQNSITIRDSSSKPSAKLIGITRLLEAGRFSLSTPWNQYIADKIPALLNAKRPSSDKDILMVGGVAVEHPTDSERNEGIPKVYYGAIGSANTLLKDEKKRDYLRDHYGVRAIEMEGSGIADGTWQAAKNYLIVRGIVDYCNEQKNNDWQTYAALCAAAYTKCIIELL